MGPKQTDLSQLITIGYWRYKVILSHNINILKAMFICIQIVLFF